MMNWQRSTGYSSRSKQTSRNRSRWELICTSILLGGDWKFLALVCGLNAANADYSCIWCKCHSKDRWNMQLKWSLSDTSKGARSIEEIKTLSKKPAKQQYGCKRLPLFESIPMDRVIIDTSPGQHYNKIQSLPAGTV